MGELIFVGLGLGGPMDMSRRAFECLREADEVFAEFYTSTLVDCSPRDLERALERPVTVLDRSGVEEGNVILESARKGKVAFMTAGDTMAATTHVDLRIRAMGEGIPTRLIHGVSIFTAAASALGLQSYKFGRTVTLPFQEENYFPTSPYDNIKENWERGLHTLVLLDINEDEGRYMSSKQAVEWLIEAENRVEGGMISNTTLICAAARVGSVTEQVAAGFPSRMMEIDMGPPLHCLVIPGRLHFMEARSLVDLAGAPMDILEDE